MNARDARLPLAVGFVAVLALVGGVGAWSHGARIAGAVLASGVVEVENDRQVVQHPDGGVIGEILARDGDRVEAGEVLIRFDDTFLRAELAAVERRLAEIFARTARLEAERDGLALPEFSPLPRLSPEGAVMLNEQIEGQRSLFETRRESLLQERRQIAEQQRQVERQIDGFRAQRAALHRQLGLVSEETADVQSLFDRGLAESARLLDLQREAARLEGEIGNLDARIAEAAAKIAALEIEELQLGQRRREDAIARLRDIGYTQIELDERRIALTERIARLDVRAPAGGIIFASRIATEGAVVRAAEPMMQIVPGDSALQVAARIDPADIDQVHPGQRAQLVFTAFSRRTTPEVPGRILRVSADAEIDEVSGRPFYTAVVQPDREALQGLDEVKLVPGMPVDAFLTTEARSPLSYLTQPFTAYFRRAFRED